MTEQTAPSAELRTAAAKLREAADGTTPGSWRYHDTHLGHLGGHTATVLAGEHNDTKLVAWLPSRSQEPWADHPCWADSRWVALASPLLAEPLAALLDETARFFDASTVQHDGRTHHSTDECGGAVDETCSCFDRARDIAAFINGTTGPTS